ncbi:MAG: amidophosphoribosyltransferase [Planctomycetes bacterium]|nr:amidophosphoribosyltransferase [Planctomycetota bacterium]
MCGVVGIIGKEEAPLWTSRGLYALQHRGHDSCGIAYINAENQLSVHSGKGAVADVLPNELTQAIDSRACLGQNLYTTYGSSHSPQPFGGRFWDADGKIHQVAVVHNGQLCGLDRLRKKYPNMYSSHSDSEVIFALLPHMKGKSILEKIISLVSELEGAFSLIFLSEEGLTAVRDSNGFRPLVLGNADAGETMLASEVNAFDLMGGHFEREVDAGEIIHTSWEGERSFFHLENRKEKLTQCVFEHIYFARPDNQLFGKPGYSTQQELGIQAARELKGKIDADVVVPVPDSATIASIAFAREIGLPMEMGLLRHHFASRTFITRGQSNRERAVRLKFNIVKDVIQGKKIILSDDSLVRSTTSKILIKMLKDGGAKEVHLVLFSPHITHSCIYGINTPTREELIAYRMEMDNDRIAAEINADSTTYLSIEGLRTAMKQTKDQYCYACMNGDYPIAKDGQLTGAS